LKLFFKLSIIALTSEILTRHQIFIGIYLTFRTTGEIEILSIVIPQVIGSW